MWWVWRRNRRVVVESDEVNEVGEYKLVRLDKFTSRKSQGSGRRNRSGTGSQRARIAKAKEWERLSKWL